MRRACIILLLLGCPGIALAAIGHRLDGPILETGLPLAGGTISGAICFEHTASGQSVCIDSDAAGDLVYYGADGTNNEDLRWDYETVANTVGVDTSTGVTMIDFASIGLEASHIESETADVADAGVVRMANTECIAWEADPTGTDETLCVDATEVLVYSGDFTATSGTITGGTLTDGTASITAGAVSGVTTIAATGNASIAGQTYDSALTTSTPAGTTQTIDWDDGNIQRLDLESATGDVTLTLSNPQITRYILLIRQDGGGGAHNVVWPGTVTWANASAPTISTGNDEDDVIELIWDGAAYFGMAAQDFQ